MKFVTPTWVSGAFNCPHCGVLAQQFWGRFFIEPCASPIGLQIAIGAASIGGNNHRKRSSELSSGPGSVRNVSSVSNLYSSKCGSCKNIAIWINDNIIHPSSGEAPPANPDMPDEIKDEYEEAASILNLSPRGSAALLRLALQKLCVVLGEPGENIFTDLVSLQKKGLSGDLVKAMHTVRIVGNESVHPGQIDLRDDRTTAIGIFRLINIIVQRLISDQKDIDKLFSDLPESKTKDIVTE